MYTKKVYTIIIYSYLVTIIMKFIKIYCYFYLIKHTTKHWNETKAIYEVTFSSFYI
jgi:hypothetical protein